MDHFKIEIIETGIVFAVLFTIRFITSHFVNKALKKFNFSLQRRRITIKMINFFLVIGTTIAIVAIWGIAKEKLIIFLSSALTILGIAFVAQWSLLSNITSGLILYFNHPLKLGDHIRILEKDFVIEGRIDDITFFFLHIKTENGDRITIPNSAILQKTISINHSDKKKNAPN